MKKSRFAILMFSFFLITSGLYGQMEAKVAKIKDITDNPGEYENELVKVTGVVTQFTEGTSTTTSYFLIQGDYGGLIKVNTSLESPETLHRYDITGTVIIDQVSRRPIIIEKGREGDGGDGGDGILIYLLIAAVALLVVFIVIYLVRTKKVAVSRPVSEPVHFESSEASDDSDYETIKINTASPPTMVLVPGELEIISGSDRGKSFKIAGHPGSDGSVVTIGREVVEGDRKYAHIQLLEKTVSRKQAEIIYRNKQLFVKNISKTNYTQVDGQSINPGELVELKPNSVIRTGEVEFRYKN